MQRNLLSIVIPAYKKEYLAETMRSLVGQTCQNFEVVVADDASPHNLELVFEQNRGRLNARFHRFPENLGRSSLTRHWDRAVRLATGSWVMLLGDDDLLDTELVSCFYTEISNSERQFDLYRFNTRKIDGDGGLVRENPPHPSVEDVKSFILSRFRCERSSYTCEYIFSREHYQRVGGFVDFPLAWCSDDATWVAIGLRNGIKTIDGAKASWRLSGLNISAEDPARAFTKICASAKYLEWLRKNLMNGQQGGVACEFCAAEIDQGIAWLYSMLYRCERTISYRDAAAMARQLSVFSGFSELGYKYKILRHNVRVMCQRAAR